MFHPPKRARRRRQPRRSALVVAGLLVLLVVGIADLRGARFPARSQQLAGSPVELRIQDDVTARELDAIADGVGSAHRFLGAVLGRNVRQAVEARVAHDDGCRNSGSGDGLIGEGDSGYICVDTANPHWRWLILNHRDAAASISAHEYVHAWQAELGCLPSGDERTFRWIVEGMASQIAWRALVRSGGATAKGVRRALRRDGAFDPDPEPLRTYERAGGHTRHYALWQLAVETLLRDAVAAGAAPRARPELALRRFCERIASRAGWREAFRRSFGFRVEDFYARFDRSRTTRRISSVSGLSEESSL